MKKKLEIQTIIVLLFVLGVAGSWLGIQITKDSLGVWTEKAELHFSTSDLLGLGPRSELHCAGTTVGRIRKVKVSLSPEGQPRFDLIAGIRKDYAEWRFAPVGIVKAGVVQSALAPSSIALELSVAPEAVKAVEPSRATPPLLKLEKEKKNNDLADVAEQYRKLGDRIDNTIRQFTDPQNGRPKSVMQELAESIPAVSTSLHQFEGVMTGLNRTQPTDADPTKLPPVEKLLFSLNQTTGNLSTTTASLNVSVGEGGKIDQTLTTLNESLARLQTLTDQMTKTIAGLNVKLDTSLTKVNGLLDETTGTMATMHAKVEGLGDTFVGRMLIKKKEPGFAAASPTTPAKPASAAARKTR